MRNGIDRRAALYPVLLGALVACAATSRGETLTYTLRVLPEEERLAVELVWQTAGRSQSRVCLPRRWGTVEDVAELVEGLEVRGAGAVERDGACWDVRHGRGAELRFSYQVGVKRGRLEWEGVHYPIVSRKLCFGMGNVLLLSPVGGGGMPDEYDVLLRWEVPEAWEAVCSWAVGKHVGARMAAEDVRHSVYLAGRIGVREVKVAGARELTVAMPEVFGFAPEEFTRVAGEIIAAQCKAMEEREFPPFVITVVPVGERVTGGQQRLVGSGLYRSFALFLPPGAQLSEGVEHLFSHELFHHWNGGLLRAEEPQRLVYWFVEGFTDYYALRILYESGRWSPAVYAKWINRHIREYHANPARNASNREIDRDYWNERETVGEVPYQRGLLLGLRWHRLARDRGVEDGVDRLFGELLSRGRRGEVTVTNEAVRAAGVRCLGDWFAEEFDRYVIRAETIDVPADALGPELEGRVRSTYEYELGFDRERSLREERVVGLKPDSAAGRAGLREGDVLIGWNVHGDVDRKIELQVVRGDDVKTVRYFPRGERSRVMQFGVGIRDRGSGIRG